MKKTLLAMMGFNGFLNDTFDYDNEIPQKAIQFAVARCGSDVCLH